MGWSQADTFALSLDHHMFCPGTAEVQKEVGKATAAHSSLENNNNKITSSIFVCSWLWFLSCSRFIHQGLTVFSYWNDPVCTSSSWKVKTSFSLQRASLPESTLVLSQHWSLSSPGPPPSLELAYPLPPSPPPTPPPPFSSWESEDLWEIKGWFLVIIMSFMMLRDSQNPRYSASVSFFEWPPRTCRPLPVPARGSEDATPFLALVPLVSGEGGKVSCLPTRQGNLLRARPGHSFLCSGATTLSYGATSLGSMHMFTVRLITNISQVYMSTLIRLHVQKNSPCAGHRLHCMDIPSAEAVWWSIVSGRETYGQSQSVSLRSWDKLSGKSSSIPLPAKQAGFPQPSCPAGLHAQHFWQCKGQDHSRWPPPASSLLFSTDFLLNILKERALKCSGPRQNVLLEGFKSWFYAFYKWWS